MGIILRGGTIVTATDYYQSDLRIENEKIVAIGNTISSPEDKVLLVEGCFLFPGGIDAHTHFDLPVGTTKTADDFSSGTKAAIIGGTTTIIDYATQYKGETLKEALSNWHRKAAGKCYADYGFHMAITDWNEAVSQEIAWLSRYAGVSSIKLYMAYKNTLQVDDDILFQAFQQSKQSGVLVCLHCENGDMIYNLVNQFRSKGETSPNYHPLSRPPLAEQEAVLRALALAEATQGSLYVVHLSCREALAAVVQAKGRGVNVYAETCPQYLLLDESCYHKPGFESAKYVIAPPLRAKENQESLWNGLRNGFLDTIATDHCSFNFYGQKEQGISDFSMIPNGMPGVENRLGLLYTYGVVTGKIAINQFVNLTATQPAKLMGLFPRKGTIAPGSDADIVVWDPGIESRITVSEQIQQVDYTPYEGFKQAGKAVHVFLRGQHLVQDGRVSDQEKCGIYIPRKPFLGRGYDICSQ
jgi:dihydropyrimidinase